MSKRGIFAMSREKGVFQVLNEKGMAVFEDTVRQTLEERRAQLNMTEQALGVLAFPHVADSRRKVQSIRKGQGSGANRKPQQLRGTDILNMCEALGLPWKEVIGKGLENAKIAQEVDRLAAIKNR